MNLLKELGLHAQALLTAVESDPKFFAGIIHYVRQLEAVTSGKADPPSKRDLQVLAEKIEAFYRQWRPSGEGFYVPPRQTHDSDGTVQEINRIVEQLAQLPDIDLARMMPIRSLPSSGPAARAEAQPRCVFVGHGRSRLWARVKMYLEEELELPTVTYESESRTGESIVPLLEKMLEQATFAVLILTAEDETRDDTKRARQNVIHEAGLFQGRLGFKKAVLLVQDGVETFTNVDGLQHIKFSSENVEQAFYELRRVLKREEQIR
jgi:predicted nucleotide-binding protein